MLIITSRKRYIDIDALSCSIGYSELLTLRGIEHQIVLPQIQNHSITPLVRSLGWEINTKIPEESSNVGFVIMDVSEPSHFASFVDSKKVVEIYDHHFGFKEHWNQQEGVEVRIEPVGSCTTLIWEEYKKAGLEDQVSELVANLFSITTLSHTLNFKSTVTTDRDIKVFNYLESKTTLPSDWVETYFREVEEELLEEPLKSLENDTKRFMMGGKEFVIAQMELWDSGTFVEKEGKEIEKFLTESTSEYAFLTAPSISEGYNHLVAYSEKIRNILEKSIGAKFEKHLGKTEKLFLRKEIVRELQKVFPITD
jgi:inorganic pyrophosphatase/exopolyphosphatase